VYATFEAFVEGLVLPARSLNPSHRRLDGQQGVGNRHDFGSFNHQGRAWKVHADTHYEPLLLAYKSWKEGSDPFVEVPTRTGRGSTLELTQALRQQYDSPHKHLYIYGA
jgi:hypothetical protein